MSDGRSEVTPLQRLLWQQRRWVAATLSGLLPGSGQLFAGRPVRAVFACAAVVGVAAAATVAVLCWKLTPLALLLPLLATLVVHLAVVGDAVRQARRARIEDDRWRSLWLHGAVLAAVTAASGPLLGMLGAQIVGVHRVDDIAMAATLLPGDVVAVSRVRCRPVGAGEVVVLVHGDDEVVRRCVAVEGSSVAVQGGVLLVDDIAVQPPLYARGAWMRTAAEGDQPLLSVPRGSLAVLGDNRELAGDWRVEIVPEERIVGRVGFILWSASSDSGIRWFRLGLPIDHRQVMELDSKRE